MSMQAVPTRTTTEPAAPSPWLRGSRWPLLATAPLICLFAVWAWHDGGYDEDTWYWGALVVLAALAAASLYSARSGRMLSRRGSLVVGLMAGYVGWSYLSITWAQSKGDALTGSNRALLYLLVFALMAVLPWTVETARLVLTAFALALGAIALLIVVRFAVGHGTSSLLLSGRLGAPTGYPNGTAALFTTQTLVALGLAARRRCPALVRALLCAAAAAGLQLAVMTQSRGWLFTLPVIALLTLLLVRDRLRLLAVAAAPVAVTLLQAHRLVAVYHTFGASAMRHAAMHAGRPALVLCAAVFVVVLLASGLEPLVHPRPLGRPWRHVLGAAAAAVILAGAVAGAAAATHGHPIAFVSREWRGFTHPAVFKSGNTSYFQTIGSSRYDFWRVALNAFGAHPVGGLGQDNFGDYYLLHRRSTEEPAWTHSLELRLLAHTGIVGAALFLAFLAGALGLALRTRLSRDRGRRGLSGVLLVPLVVWVIHGSVDWFWELPALTGPALGFLGVAVALTRQARPAGKTAASNPFQRTWTLGRLPLGMITLFAAVAVLGFPYLAVREISTASDIAGRNPAQALDKLALAAEFNPLSALPGRLGGTIALREGNLRIAAQRFREAISNQPGGWYGWLGEGLAQSALGNTAQARHDFSRAAAINRVQPAVIQALARVDTTHPLTPPQALALLAVP